MIIYSPIDGEVLTSAVRVNPRHCFLMTRLGHPIPDEVQKMRGRITEICHEHGFEVVDAASKISGRDFLLKIWKMIASATLAIGICHEGLSAETRGNIFYELGVAQGLGKETLLVKSPGVSVPSDFVRTEYIEFSESFSHQFSNFLEGLQEQALHYETVASQLDNNPVLAIDYLRRAYLLTGDARVQFEVKQILKGNGLESRARNSVELLAASF